MKVGDRVREHGTMGVGSKTGIGTIKAIRDSKKDGRVASVRWDDGAWTVLPLHRLRLNTAPPPRLPPLVA